MGAIRWGHLNINNEVEQYRRLLYKLKTQNEDSFELEDKWAPCWS